MQNAIITEFHRLLAAFGYSFDGLKAAWKHPAFRIEALVVCIMLPLGLVLGQSSVARALLAGSLMAVLIVELLNTGIEAALDRVSTERHPLAKLAKDVGSAAVLLSILNAGIIWLVILFF